MFFAHSSYASIASALLLLLSASAAGVRATDHTGIPQAFTQGFDPESGLQVTYGAAPDAAPVQDGADLSGQDLSRVPRFALGESSGINTNAKFIVLMIDPDVNGDPDVVAPQTLHYLRTDFAPTGQAVNIASEAAPAVKYVGPEATQGGNPGPHRYVFLLYKQPRDGFQLKGVSPDKRTGFDVRKWRDENDLEPAVAGVHFIAEPQGDQAGGNPGYGQPGETTTTVVKDKPVQTQQPDAPAAPPPPPSQGDVRTIVHTVTVTGDCGCASATNPPVATGGGTGGGSPPAAAATHTVVVGGPAGLVYTPEFVMANAGDKVVFDFLARNHTVTQSTLNQPCVFKANGGVRSGFRPNPDNTPGKELFEVAVEDTEPRWFYCAQANHCAKGMVFAINPKDKFPEFKQLAMSGGNGGNSTNSTNLPATPSGSNVAVPVITGAASALTAQAASVLLGLVAVVAAAAVV